MKKVRQQGFTLIELSIVLVIIGLIVGGVLVGQDLIRAAEVRAQISQIEKYNTAVNTFIGKYGALPGDMNLATANQFGFLVGANCDGTKGSRDGNGLIDGDSSPTLYQGLGETEYFWNDLSVAGLVEGYFPNGGGNTDCQDSGPMGAVTNIGEFLPGAKIGKGNFVYVYETSGANWYGLSAITGLGNNTGSGTTIPVLQAYSIDKKIDDGVPTTGTVQAVYVSSPSATALAPNAASDSASTCYNTTGPAYSIALNNGAGANCALSFRFQ